MPIKKSPIPVVSPVISHVFFQKSGAIAPGDWVRMGDREHGAKGLCQERALVSGLEVPKIVGHPRKISGN